MPLLGPAAMLLSFDIEASAIEEHDRWHTHEHLPERLSIPGFLRGTRWTNAGGEGEGQRYMVVYEVAGLDVLSSEAYLTRLNNPTLWTQRMMPHYRGMQRGLCAVAGSFGLGQGGVAALIRFTPEAARADALQRWLLEEALHAVPTTPGLGSAHLLQGAQQAAMTKEQSIRGADQGVDSAIILTGYDAPSLAAHAQALGDGLAARGARGIHHGLYRCAYALAAAEINR